MMLSLQVLLPLTCLYVLYVIIYRLFLSPLSKIPGPKLAALTGWYESYYDFYKGGQWMRRIEEMHKHYGPIIRISPREVHIHDPAFVNDIYMTRYSKDIAWVKSIGQNMLSVGTTPDFNLHAPRRAALNPFFSRAGITARLHQIEACVDELCDRIATLCREDKVFNLDHAFTAVTLDIIASFAYGRSFRYLQKPQFAQDWHEMMKKVFSAPPVIRAIPFSYYMFHYMPSSVVKFLNPRLTAILNMTADVQQQTDDLLLQMREGKLAYQRGDPPATIFEQILASALPEEEKAPRLTAEGMLVLAAGSDTTAKALAMTLYHLLKDKARLSKLRKELTTIMPAAESPLPLWTRLEQLPYLTAVIKEGTRLAGSVSSRMSRIANRDVVYGEYVIPAGTPFGQTAYLLLLDGRTWPRPLEFIPERWLIHDDSSVGSVAINKTLNEHMIAWSKGPMNCLGMHLAYAEMYVVLARILTRFELDLWGTQDEDIKMARDLFMPFAKEGSPGLRVKVKRDNLAHSL